MKVVTRPQQVKELLDKHELKHGIEIDQSRLDQFTKDMAKALEAAHREPIGDAIEIKVPLETMQFVLSKVKLKRETIAKRLLLHDTYLIDKWIEGTADEYDLEVYTWRLKVLASLTRRYNWAIFLIKPKNLPK